MSNNLLKGKRGIIFGALNDQSIAWKVAERAVEEGATITLSNTPMAIRMGEVNALAEKLNCQVVPADAPDRFPAVNEGLDDLVFQIVALWVCDDEVKHLFLTVELWFNVFTAA